MTPIITWATRNPVRALAVASAILAGLAPIIPAAATTAVLAVLSALLGVGVHHAVTPVAVATETAVRAASSAATQVARDLDASLAGPVGFIPPIAERIVDQAIADAVR